MDYYVEYHHHDRPAIVERVRYERQIPLAPKPCEQKGTTYNSYGKVFTVYNTVCEDEPRAVEIQPQVVYAAPHPIVESPPPYLPPEPAPAPVVPQQPQKEAKVVDDTKDKFMRDCMRWYQSVRECTRIWNSDPDASVSD
jgi:hypothetical protein